MSGVAVVVYRGRRGERGRDIFWRLSLLLCSVRLFPSVFCSTKRRAFCSTGRGGGGCTRFMHGRRRVAIDPRIPTMPGRSMSGFHRPGRLCYIEGRGELAIVATLLCFIFSFSVRLYEKKSLRKKKSSLTRATIGVWYSICFSPSEANISNMVAFTVR